MKITSVAVFTVVLVVSIALPFLKKWVKLLWAQIKFRINNKKDSPLDFGYKIMWIAVKTEAAEKVAASIGLKKLLPSNWKNGIERAYENAVFISPPLNGWTIAVGMKLPAGDSIESIKKIKTLLKKLSAEFGEAQFFCTHRVVEYHCWIKATNGKVQRAYAYLGESGENIIIEGKPTPIESNLNLINTFSPEAQQEDYFERENIVYPDEELVMTIAGSWSIDPTQISKFNHTKGMGLIG